MKKKLKIVFVALSLVLFVGFMGYTLYTNSVMKKIEGETDMRLSYYEKVATQVSKTVIQYLLVVDSTSYKVSKDSANVSDSFLNTLYGETYSPTLFIGAEKVTVNSYDFSLSSENEIHVLLDITYEKSGEKFDISMIVSTLNGEIYDMIVGG